MKWIPAALLLFLGLASRSAVATDGLAASVDGAMISYHAEGPARPSLPAVVLVHCWACDRHLWDGQVPFLAKTYRVVTLDLAGHGDSTRGSRKDFSIAAFGEDVKAVVQALDLKKVILVGHSMGGPVSLEAARRLPGRVAGIVPVDTLTDVDRDTRPEEIDAFFAPFHADYRPAVEKFVREWMFVPGTDARLIDRIVARAVSTPPDVGLSALENAFRYDARSALKEIRVPIHAINTDKFPTNLDAERRYAPQFDATILKRHGHYLMLEDPKEFGDALAPILADMSATASPPASEARVALFAEDSTLPLDLRQGRATESAGITEMDIGFAVPSVGNVPATLVFPPGAGPFAGVVFMLSGDGPGSQRDDFLSEARNLAPSGVVSLLIDSPFAPPEAGATPFFGFTDRDRDGIVQSVVDVRRALDILRTRPQVDDRRIAFVGAGYGATVGAILAGVERRFAAFVLISGVAKVTFLLDGSPSAGAVKLRNSGVMALYLERMAVVDPDQWVALPRKASILFQWGEQDPDVPRASAEALFAAAAEPKARLRYDAGHTLNALARKQRAEFLAPALQLKTASDRTY